MGDIAASREDIEKFTSHLVADTREKIQGSHIDSGERTPPGLTPRTNFFSGALVPEEENPEIDREIQSRTSPSSLTLIGRISESEDEQTVSVEIEVSFAVYYRVIPTPSEQAEAADVNPTVYQKFEVGDDSEGDGVHGVRLNVDFEATPDNTGKIDDASARAQRVLNREIREAIESHITERPDLYEEDERAIEGFITDREGMDDEEFLAELREAVVGGDEEFVPIPEIGVDIRLLEAFEETAATESGETDSAVIRVDITNESDEDSDFEEVDLATYETELALRGRNGAEFQDMAFEEVPEGFRYDSAVPGQGENCTVRETADGNGIRSETVPLYEQPYFGHEQFEGRANPRFDELSEDPLPVLRAIRRELKDYRDNAWEDKLSEVREIADNPEDDETVAKVEEGIRDFEEEIERYERGVNLLEDDEVARELFKNVNQVFLRKVRKGDDPWDEDAELEYKRWRPFQIVFIVSILPDIMAEERDFSPDEHSRDLVDLLYFPTGGGKTEAYLALIVFTVLFDRRRGKNFGVSSMMRFPLRLLSLQQFQRVVEILTHADEVRKEMDYGGEPLSAGFFTGNTKNSLIDLLTSELDWDPRGDYPKDREQLEKNRQLLEDFSKRWNRIGGEDLYQINREDYRTVEKCPICGSDVDLVFNTESDRIEHHCSSDTCRREKLNVYVTDEDIYRGIPSIILGTQDKLAALGYNYRFRTLAGYVSHRCPEHGYTHRADDCMAGFFCGRDSPETEPEDGGLKPVNNEYPVPTLILQDELHLINEDLGTFESHYYGAYEKHLEWAAESQGVEFTEPKKIAATATIEESDNQVKHLYGGNETNRFPKPGPDYRESAYTYTDENRTQRYYLGVVPWNRSQINSIIRVLEMHQRRIQEMLSNPQHHLSTFDFDELSDPDEFENLLSHYYTLVTYVISKFEGGRMHKSTETQVNDNLTSDGLDAIDRFSMQGNTDADEMAEMLNLYEQVGETGGTSHQDLYGLITATSSISHGVDLDALGYMLFFNAPPRMSEYIQASSRVGRKYPGIILNMFDPIGERDRSHYHYFHKYHEYMDRLVEPVAINRWAKFSVKRTFPGLFMSLLQVRYFDEISKELGYFKNKASPKMARKAEKAGVIDQDELIDDLVEMYGEDWETGRCPFEDRIEDLVYRSFDRIGAGDGEDIADCLVGRLMTSLRDVDEQIEIRPGKEHYDAFDAVGVKK